MEHGDFTELAKYYNNRPGYSKVVLECLKDHICCSIGEMKAADVGAGTGKLTEGLAAAGLGGYAVEPNDAMRAEAQKACACSGFQWLKGTAENTGLKDNCVGWALMGSSFHWTDSRQAMK